MSWFASISPERFFSVNLWFDHRRSRSRWPSDRGSIVVNANWRFGNLIRKSPTTSILPRSSHRGWMPRDLNGISLFIWALVFQRYSAVKFRFLRWFETPITGSCPHGKGYVGKSQIHPLIHSCDFLNFKSAESGRPVGDHFQLSLEIYLWSNLVFGIKSTTWPASCVPVFIGSTWVGRY